MEKERLKKILISIFSIFIVAVIAFYFLLGEQLLFKDSTNNSIMPEADNVSIEIVEGVVVEQDFINHLDKIDRIAFVCHTYWRSNSGTMYVELLDENRQILKQEINVNEIEDQHRVFLNIEKPIEGLKDKELTIKISSNSKPGLGVCLMTSSTNIYIRNYVANNTLQTGAICFETQGKENIALGAYYWIIMGIAILFVGIVLFISYKKYCIGKTNIIVSSILAINKYNFLISQLVSRDFKTKYKRSVFGVFWSFLNPLLSMLVQFIVFSTFFKADTKNYPVYLISGVVCFSFFNQCTTKCLSSISGNYRLITKVYIPKYIFPLAKTISSSVDLFISLIPLLLVTLITGTQIHSSFLLIFYFLACLIIFSLGVGMVLATLMVFFRDIEFLWSVLCTIWQYATPIFYPAEIIPDKFKFIIQFNPLYHFIGCARRCLIDGISPEPIQFLYCLVFALGAFAIGSYIFKKCQDKFTLYL